MVPRAALRKAANARRSATMSAVCKPVRVRAARSLAKPSGVRGPVLGPPCIRQRPLAIAGPRHGCPARVRAPQSLCVMRMGFSSLPGIEPSPRGDRPDYRLSTVLDDDPLNPNDLRPLASAPVYPFGHVDHRA